MSYALPPSFAAARKAVCVFDYNGTLFPGRSDHAFLDWLGQNHPDSGTKGAFRDENKTRFRSDPGAVLMEIQDFWAGEGRAIFEKFRVEGQLNKRFSPGVGDFWAWRRANENSLCVASTGMRPYVEGALDVLWPDHVVMNRDFWPLAVGNKADKVRRLAEVLSAAGLDPFSVFTDDPGEPMVGGFLWNEINVVGTKTAPEELKFQRVDPLQRKTDTPECVKLYTDMVLRGETPRENRVNYYYQWVLRIQADKAIQEVFNVFSEGREVADTFWLWQLLGGAGLFLSEPASIQEEILRGIGSLIPDFGGYCWKLYKVLGSLPGDDKTPLLRVLPKPRFVAIVLVTRNEGKEVFITQRARGDFQGSWSLTSGNGASRFLENPIDAAGYEVLGDLECKTRNMTFMKAELRDPADPKSLPIYVYRCEIDGEPKLNPRFVSAGRWVSREEALTLPMAFGHEEYVALR